MHYSLVQEEPSRLGMVLFILLLLALVYVPIIVMIVRMRRRQIAQELQFQKDMAEIDAWNAEADRLLGLLEQTEDEAERLKIEEQLSALFQKVIDKL